MQFNLAGVGILFILLVEIILSTTWNKYYFSIGLPVFVRRVPASPQNEIPPNILDLETEFQSSFTGLSLVFKDLSSNEYGFKEKLVEYRFFRITPVMHGYLKYDYNRRQVIVKGYANWIITAFSILGFIIAGEGLPTYIPFIIIGFLILVIGIPYAIQATKFNKVAFMAASLWSSSSQPPIFSGKV